MTDRVAGYEEPSQVTLALVLGIASIACLPLLGPAAWAVARDELRAIDSGRRDPSRRRTAAAARVLGIIGSILLVAVVLAGLIVLVVTGPEIIRGIMNSPEEGLEAALASGCCDQPGLTAP